MSTQDRLGHGCKWAKDTEPSNYLCSFTLRLVTLCTHAQLVLVLVELMTFGAMCKLYSCHVSYMMDIIVMIMLC